jgi:hypothetical protein
MTKPFITLFTAPKPFVHPHIAMIQRNAIRSWVALGDEVEVLLLGREDGLEEAARELGVRWIPDLERNTSGTPLISSMFTQAREQGHGDLLAIINTDILLMSDFVQAARSVSRQAEIFLMMGHRWDIDITEPLSFEGDWQVNLRRLIAEHGQLHKSMGSDYFMFPRDAFPAFPPFAIGRAGWDNWTIYHGRQQGWKVIESTLAVTIGHQQHDYHHLPNGEIHYNLPESAENLRLAGGKRHIFTLIDANCRLDEHANIKPMPFIWRKIRREMEIYPVLKWHHPRLNLLAFYVMNPRKFILQRFPDLARRLGIRLQEDNTSDALTFLADLKGK